MINVNANTVYAYACCLSIHGFCETHEEAQKEASLLEPVRIGDYYENGYVLTIEPGMVSDDLYQGSEGTNDYIILWGDQMYCFCRPTWMTMIDDGKHTPLDSLDEIQGKIENQHLKQKFEKFKKREVISDRAL
jgi:hypothetical protein